MPTNYTLEQTKCSWLLPVENRKGKKSWWRRKGSDKELHVPAVHNNGSCFWGIEKLHLTNEAQEACGIARNAVVWPAGEVELPNLSDLMVAFLRRQHSLYFSVIRLQSAHSNHCSFPSHRGLNSIWHRNRFYRAFHSEVSSWTPSTNEVDNVELRTMKVKGSSQLKSLLLEFKLSWLRTLQSDFNASIPWLCFSSLLG